MTRLLSALVLLTLAAAPAAADPIADFYKGKTIRMIVGSSPGDYDSWARLIVRYLPKYIPGNPGFVVENMPGRARSSPPTISTIAPPKTAPRWVRSAATFRIMPSRRSPTSSSIR